MIVELNKIKEGDVITGFFLVKEVSEGNASTGKPFLTLLLSNSTGVIGAKRWDRTEEDSDICKAGEIIKVRGPVKTYRDALQLNIEQLRSKIDNDNVDISQLVQVAPIDTNVVDQEIKQTIEEMKDEDIKVLIKTIYYRYREGFLKHVAATKNHHNMVSGLAWHVSTMLAIGKRIAPIYPAINESLLYAAIIAHDLGKLWELENPIAPAYSKEGKLRGHISIMDSIVHEIARELNQEGKLSSESEAPLLLSTCILSHHGKQEWGSPVEPKLIEAELLHHIDNIDAKMNMITNAFKDGEPGNFYRVDSMRREFYMHSPINE